jgi:hypothetical protein
MTETLAALVFAHVLADFVFQTGTLAQDKQDRRIAALALHALIVAATLVIALGQPAPLLLALVAAHLALDLAKSTLPRARLWPFIADQAAHLLTLAAFAAWQPDLWRGGLWAGLPWLPGTMALITGALITTRAGGFAVGLLMRPWANVRLPKGLPKGGTLIGLLERGVIFVLVLVGQPGGIGFLIAAKSVLRFETTSKDTRAGEYVIIGTLASFGWALVGAYATRALLLRLPPLGILPLTP